MYCQHGETEGNCRFHVLPGDFRHGPAPVICKHRNVENECRYCLTSGAWAIVKDGKGMRENGHDRALQWAREYLGLVDRGEVFATRNPHDPEHIINDD